jgi:glycine hydroxymethyltransferase
LGRILVAFAERTMEDNFVAQTSLEIRHFSGGMAETDPRMYDILKRERIRQANEIELMAAENIASHAVLQALGSAITNKTVEGYPGSRFHGGARIIDEAETLAIERAKELFGCGYANVQPHSGSQANQAIFVALLKPGDTILSMALAAGGHLSHGAAPHMSGKWFHALSYGVDERTGLLNYDEMERLAREHRPKLIIAGGSAYPRVIDFKRVRLVADEVGATFLVDMAHFAGLVAGGAHPSPVPHAHITSTTTMKTLRGPHGGILLSNDLELGKRLDSAVFPGAQGSVHLNNVAAKAVCLGEALRPEFGEYAARVVSNARVLAEALQGRGLGVMTGGTDTHLVLVDVKTKGLTGDQAEKVLEVAGITCNKNVIPGDPKSPKKWSGIRLATSSGTTRGLGGEHFARIGDSIADVLESVGEDGEPDADVAARVKGYVSELCKAFPTYPERDL